MRKFTNAEIAEIRANLNNGMVYCGICNGRGMGTIRISADDKWICWRHFGESANKNSDKELRWVIENIFDDCETITPAEYSKYHVNYVPIDKQYKAIDMSMKHPNVWGI